MDSRTSREGQAGIVLPLMAISLVGLLAVAGLALDTGEVYEDYRRAQTAADAAALAGTFERFYGRDGSIITSAQAGATATGFPDNVDGVDVVVNHPPSTGFYAGDDFSVEVTVSQPSPTSFLRVLGINTIDYTARAVANGNTANGINCVIVLDPNREKAFEVSSDSQLDARCGIWVNSSNRFGSKVESGACVKASTITVVGGYKEGQICDEDGGPAYECESDGDCPISGYGKPIAEQPAPVPDPFVGLTAPAVNRSSCPPPSCNASGCSGEPDGAWYKPYTKEDGGTHTLNAGTYCGGIYVKGGTDVVFNPGLYILRGGGLVIEGGGTTAEGEDVTFYNTCFNACTGSESASKDFWPLEIKSSAGTDGAGAPDPVDLAAPLCDGGASGRECVEPLDGILWMSDRAAPSSPDPGAYPVNRIDSNANAIFSGAIYVWNQHLKFHSNATGDEGGNVVLVSKFLEVSSNSSVEINNFSDADGGGSPLKRVTLVE